MDGRGKRLLPGMGALLPPHVGGLFAEVTG